MTPATALEAATQVVAMLFDAIGFPEAAGRFALPPDEEVARAWLLSLSDGGVLPERTVVEARDVVMLLCSIMGGFDDQGEMWRSVGRCMRRIASGPPVLARLEAGESWQTAFAAEEEQS